jgi:hypothetical protein
MRNPLGIEPKKYPNTAVSMYPRTGTGILYECKFQSFKVENRCRAALKGDVRSL